MMMPSSKPIGSTIEVQHDFNQTVISWKNPRGGFGRYANLLFLTAWMGGWVMGEAMAVRAVLSGQAPGMLLLWLIGWTVGGIYCGTTLFQLARPSRPEKITLDPLCLSYDPGTKPTAAFLRRDRTHTPLEIFKSTKLVLMPKADISNLRIDRIDERQRLSFDCEAKRIEVGKYLTEPEREWLFCVLQSWLSNQHRVERARLLIIGSTPPEPW